jgi:bifunctional non-homologous end joining protein LigD
MPARKLADYQSKRDFARTREPSGLDAVPQAAALRFVIQKHDARNLHFDLRLEHDGVFKSWAVPKGPSLDPKDRRLAMEVEDHPLDYGAFEGTIPRGEYGGGTVMIWDRGHWAPEPGFEDIGRALADGELKFVMEGGRMHGSWVLVRTKLDPRGKQRWILIKHRDAAAEAGDPHGPDDGDRSVASDRTMAAIAAGRGAAPKPFMAETGSAVADPPKPRAGRAPERKRKASALPAFIAPQLATARERPASGPGWVHEIKFDGYRMQLRTERGTATLKSRKGLDWSDKFHEIAKSGAGLPDGIIDGEVVALDDSGAPDFAALQTAISDGKTADLVFFAFDRMFAGAEDLRPLPLEARKARLAATLKDTPPNLRFVEHFGSGGDAVLRSACRMHLEGIVSKRLDAPYRSGRSEAWTKSKCRAGHEVVIGGYTTTKGAFRSLIAGVMRDGRLLHVGRIGTGFGRETVARILPRLRKLETAKSPFRQEPPSMAGEVRWLRPELVAEIEYEGFTGDGQLRQAAFKGLRADKPADEVEAETPAPVTTLLKKPKASAGPARTVKARGSATVMGVVISHEDKALWPDAHDGKPVTKADLARYFEAVGAWMLAHIRGRPCSILCCPDGIDGAERFFQRHAAKGQSSLITAVTVAGEAKPYLQFDRVEALIAAAQVAALELHPWNGAPDDPDQPARLVFDLDPAPDVAFDRVADAAREIRDRLEALGLIGFCKTTGGKGLHVVVPIKAKAIGWKAAKEFALGVCRAMEADAPDRYVVSMAKKKRDGRIFLDYLRNDRTATAVAVLSPRARPGATVSMPIGWSQLKKGFDAGRYTIRTVPALLGKVTAWDAYDESARPLAPAMKRLGRT